MERSPGGVKPELQNVNLFTRNKTIKPNFTRRKARKSRQFLHQNWQRGYFWRTDVDNSVKLWKIRQTFHIDCANLLQKIWQNCVFSQTFTPTCQYFYTDISVISVTFCNSEENMIFCQKFWISHFEDRRAGGMFINISYRWRCFCFCFCAMNLSFLGMLWIISSIKWVFVPWISNFPGKTGMLWIISNTKCSGIDFLYSTPGFVSWS